MERQHTRLAGQPPGKGRLSLRAWLERSLGVGAALILFSLMLITCVDVVGRYLLGTPLAGAFELTEVLVAALVFAAFPLTTERREHVEVDLLGAVLKGPVGRAVTALAGLSSAAVLAVFAWRLAVHAIGTMEDGAVTNALSIPLAPLGFLASASCLVSAILACLRGLHAPDDDWQGQVTDAGEGAP